MLPLSCCSMISSLPGRNLLLRQSHPRSGNSPPMCFWPGIVSKKDENGKPKQRMSSLTNKDIWNGALFRLRGQVVLDFSAVIHFI